MADYNRPLCAEEPRIIIPRDALGRWFRRYRADAPFRHQSYPSRAQMAALLGVSIASWRRWVSGRVTPPLWVMRRLCGPEWLP